MLPLRSDSLPQRRLTYMKRHASIEEQIARTDLGAPCNSRVSKEWETSESACQRWADEVQQACVEDLTRSEPCRRKSRLWLDLTEDHSSIEEARAVKMAVSPDKPRMTSITRPWASTSPTTINSNKSSSPSNAHERFFSLSLSKTSRVEHLSNNVLCDDPQVRSSLTSFESLSTSTCSLSLTDSGRLPQTSSTERSFEVLEHSKALPIESSEPPASSRASIIRRILSRADLKAAARPVQVGAAAEKENGPVTSEPQVPESYANILDGESQANINALEELVNCSAASPVLQLHHAAVIRIQASKRTAKSQRGDDSAIDLERCSTLSALHDTFQIISSDLIDSLYATELALQYLDSILGSLSGAKPQLSQTEIQCPKPTNALGFAPKAFAMLGLQQPVETPPAVPVQFLPESRTSAPRPSIPLSWLEHEQALEQAQERWEQRVTHVKDLLSHDKEMLWEWILEESGTEPVSYDVPSLPNETFNEVARMYSFERGHAGEIAYDDWDRCVEDGIGYTQFPIGGGDFD